MRQRGMRLALSILVFLSLATLVQAKGDGKNGEKLAKQWCATCHVVTPEQTTASADAPSFTSIAGNPLKSNDYLTGFLIDPHPPMPNLNLSRQEIADVIAYINSLN
ncbi:MAG: c-type cytochrome [Stappiaceae bacterium]